ncbi:PREDICTED: uncharacterized protein LOC104730697 [Camelina sativa]|uniref:Uncharacterized protein LOC104730697 n=1 Tax=Camelina sativa TaxID=90675 RepID=A0ABM0UYJ4_CAMSA|nr:PREDICTED: uncharacterized protein LOC104730697 [Camelina sativa]XP_010448193.1 PREDICTED: uncharacterized protein LOC104730697 [Camelina sativa]
MEKNNMRDEVWSSWRDGDFQEDDVWDVLDHGYQSSFMISNHTSKPCFSTQTNLLPSEPRMIPERQRIEGMAPMRQHSAPLNVPDWSMVHPKKTKKKVDHDDDNVSPEEYFMGRRSSSSSVMEGVGRKLKGRDLSRVRNAILKQTGFLE